MGTVNGSLKLRIAFARKNNTINSHNHITNNYTTIAHKFDRIYSLAKWNRSNNKYLLAIPKSEHAINNPCSITVLRQNRDQWEEVIVDKSLYDDDPVKIISDLAFDVRVIIM